MSVYARFKRNSDGLRSLVELWETTPLLRRQKMIDIGRAEDAAFTEKVLKYLFTFEDILQLPDPELAALIAAAPTRVLVYSIAKASDEVQKRFLAHAALKRGEISDQLEFQTAGLGEVGAAQLKMIEIARSLEKRGVIKTKRIPLSESA